jgi:hypothetical protein
MVIFQIGALYEYEPQEGSFLQKINKAGDGEKEEIYNDNQVINSNGLKFDIDGESQCFSLLPFTLSAFFVVLGLVLRDFCFFVVLLVLGVLGLGLLLLLLFGRDLAALRLVSLLEGLLAFLDNLPLVSVDFVLLLPLLDFLLVLFQPVFVLIFHLLLLLLG